MTAHILARMVNEGLTAAPFLTPAGRFCREDRREMTGTRAIRNDHPATFTDR